MSKQEKKSDAVSEEKESKIVLATADTKWEASNHYAEPLVVGKGGIEDFTVVLPWKERNEILAAAKATHGEIAGWGEAEVDVIGQTITLGRIAIPEQEAGAANAEIDGAQTHELALAGELDLSKAIVSWHSHVNMDAAPSPVDTQLYRKASDMMPVFVGIVMNKKNMWWVEVWVKTAMGPLRFRPILEFQDPIAAPMEHIEELVKKRLKEPPRKDYSRYNKSQWRGNQFFLDETLQVWSRLVGRFVDAPKGYNGPSGRYGEDPLNGPDPEIRPYAGHSNNFIVWEFLGVTAYLLPMLPKHDCEEETCDKPAHFRLVFTETKGPRSYCADHAQEIRTILVRGEGKIAKERVRRQKKESKQLILLGPPRVN